MSRKLKVYGGCFDGRTRVITAAYSQREAFEQMRACQPSLSFHHFRNYSGETGNDIELQLAYSIERSVWQSSINDQNYKRIDI